MTFRIAIVPQNTRGRWAFTGVRYKAAHFILEETGANACAIFAKEIPTLGELRGPWLDLDTEDAHLCSYCRRVKAQRCTCGRCSAEEANRAAARARKALHK